MKKFIFCVSLSLMGLVTACVDKNEVVDAESKPESLGSSIYQELKNANQQRLTGTFKTYLQLVEDVGEANTLDHTGSRTVFPANDDAFERFFKNNIWGVGSYEELTDGQKRQLVYNSMLDNALLLSMLSNISDNSDASNPTVMRGMALKHETSDNPLNSLELVTPDKMPNCKFWDKYRLNPKGIYVVRDYSSPQMVHFTREQMLSKGLTTKGDDSDFSILTGTPYEAGAAYIFNVGIQRNEAYPENGYNSDITCLNGYIHQVEDVIVPPGNLAQVIARENNTQLYSYILDKFSVPVVNSSAMSFYNSSAIEEGRDTITIYDVRYLNAQSEHALLAVDGNVEKQLKFDIGWNAYTPIAKTSTLRRDMEDIGVMFVPTDDAVTKFFTQGEGAYLIDIYGSKSNTAENLKENLDSLHSKASNILTDFVRNMMKSSFVENVPSRFTEINNDESENMGVNISKLARREDGKYDIRIANNGVVYKVNEVFTPDAYRSVMAPANTYPEMDLMKAILVNQDYSYYLTAMNSNLVFFTPDNDAFDKLYIDPASLATIQPRALHFYMDKTVNPAGVLTCKEHDFDKLSGTISETPRNGNVSISSVSTQLADLLNYHTLILDKDEVLGENQYYRTKQNAAIFIEDTITGSSVSSGKVLDFTVDPAVIKVKYNEKNGKAFRMDHVIQPTVKSVYSLLGDYTDRFSEFEMFCSNFSDDDLLKWAGIAEESPYAGMPSPLEAYRVFVSTKSVSDENGKAAQAVCVDRNVKLFNTYHYTLYAPNNDAMQKAYDAGLPKWSELQNIYETYSDENAAEDIRAQESAKKQEVLAKLNVMRDFIRYHFQTTAVFADKSRVGNRYQSLSLDALGLANELVVSNSESGQFTVTDNAKVKHVIDANNTSLLTNQMTQEYWFLGSRIFTSSACTVHEIDEPLWVNSSKSYTVAAARSEAKMRLKKQNKL